MSWLQFIADLCKSFAWPTAAVAMVWLLRTPLYELIPLLKELEYKGLKAKFSKEVKEAEKIFSTIPENTITILPGNHDVEVNRFDTMLTVLPAGAVAEAWHALETAIEEAAKRLHLSTDDFWTTAFIKLRKAGWVSHEQARLIEALEDLRNLAVRRRPPISYDEGKQFLSMIQPLIRYFRNLTPESPKVATVA